jgi:hypothetical protein
MSVIRAAFDFYREGEDIRFTAACWLIEGTRATKASP